VRLRRVRMKNLGFSIIVVMVGLLLASCGGPESAPTSTPTTPTVNAGKLFEANCVACHGANRQGMPNLGPALTPDSLAALNDAEINDIILNGRPDTVMTPWNGKLSSEEIDALVQFIKNTSP
tara:strand:- start:79 stop:444 length:366 start_codon:yes stop_codon:yes gene_type:complete